MKETIEQLHKEKKELNALINKGVEFTINADAVVVSKYLFGLIKRRKLIRMPQTFKITEMTLSTLDRVSSIWIDFAVQKAKLEAEGLDENSLAKRLIEGNTHKAAKCLAIAVLGEDRFKTKSKGHFIQWVEDDKKINHLTRLFEHNIKPSDMQKLFTLIYAMSNLADFYHSIMLASAERTTMPTVVEA